MNNYPGWLGCKASHKKISKFCNLTVLKQSSVFFFHPMITYKFCATCKKDLLQHYMRGIYLRKGGRDGGIMERSEVESVPICHRVNNIL